MVKAAAGMRATVVGLFLLLGSSACTQTNLGHNAQNYLVETPLCDTFCVSQRRVLEREKISSLPGRSLAAGAVIGAVLGGAISGDAKGAVAGVVVGGVGGYAIGVRASSDRRTALEIAEKVAKAVNSGATGVQRSEIALSNLINSRKEAISSDTEIAVSQLAGYRMDIALARDVLSVKKKSFASASAYEEALGERKIRSTKLVSSNKSLAAAISSFESKLRTYNEDYLRIAGSTSGCSIQNREEDEDYTTIPLPSCEGI